MKFNVFHVAKKCFLKHASTQLLNIKSHSLSNIPVGLLIHFHMLKTCMMKKCQSDTITHIECTSINTENMLVTLNMTVTQQSYCDNHAVHNNTMPF